MKGNVVTVFSSNENESRVVLLPNGNYRFAEWNGEDGYDYFGGEYHSLIECMVSNGLLKGDRIGQFLIDRVSNAISDSNVRLAARAFMEIKELSSSIEKAVELAKSFLLDNEVDEIFMEEGKKVFVAPGNVQTAIDVKGLGSQMFLENRFDQFLSIVKTTQADLKTLDDGEQLIAKYKSETGRAKSTVKSSKLSKDDYKKLQKVEANKEDK